jgi:hypothetical protein
MPKLPAFQFYPGDWMKDPKVSMLSPAARGVWIDLICAMHEAGRSGELCGTTDQLARITRCSTAEFVQALTDIQATEVADVTERNGKITVVNRRMKREHKDREGNKLRQSRFRNNGSSNKKVTPITSSSSSSSNTEIQISLDWDFEREKFTKDGKWIYKFCMEKKLKPHEFDSLANEFLSDLELKEDYKPIKEIRSHFINWFNKKNSGGKLKIEIPIKTGPSVREIEEAENRKKLGI